MKKTIASALFMAAALMAPIASAADGDGIKQFTLGEVTVYPIMDSQGEMDAAIFSGPLTEEEKAAYMPGGKAPAGVNVFLLKTPSGNVLIDAGWGLSGPGGAAVTERLKLSGLSADDIDLVLLTHAHSDHIGGLLNGREPFFSKARVMLSAPELQSIGGSAPVHTPDEALVEVVEEGIEHMAAPVAAPAPAPPARDEMHQAMIDAYGERLAAFEFGAEIVPGLTAVDAAGHTPGHTAFLLKSGDQELLFVGDIVHAAALQFPEPEECATYDRDKERAVASRKRLLTQASESKLPVAGAHIPFPGLGFVQPDGKRGFTFTPQS